MSVTEKPGLREQLVTALGAPNLSSSDHRECAVDRVAAFGATQLGMQPQGSAGVACMPLPANADVEHDGPSTRLAGEFASVDVSPERPVREPSGAAIALVGLTAPLPTIAIEPHLAAILVRLKYLHERSRVEQAVILLARVLWQRPRRRSLFGKAHGMQQMIRVAEHVIVEWSAGACPKCAGIGRRGATMADVREFLVPCRTCERKNGKPTGTLCVKLPGLDKARRISCPACCGKLRVIDRQRVRGKVGTPCGRCSGTGIFRPDHGDRAAALGLGKHIYVKHWAKIFDSALRAVRALDRELVEDLRDQLGRGINRAA